MALIGPLSRLRRLMPSLRTELAVAAIRSLALNVAAKLLALLGSVLLARWLGANGFGIYASSIAVATVLSVLAQFGLPTFIIRTLPAYEVQQQWGLLRGLLRRADVFVLSSSLLLAAAAFVVIMLLEGRLSHSYAVALMWATAMIPVVALNALRSAALRGFRHVVAGQLAERLISPALFVALITTWWLIGVDGSPTLLTTNTAVAIRFVVAVLAFIVGSLLLTRHLPTDLTHAMPQYDSANWLRGAAPLLFLSVATIVNAQTDVLMLALLKGASSAGVYQAAARGAELVVFSLFVINVVVQPTISRLNTLGDRQRLQTVVTAAVRMALALALPVALVLALFAHPILSTVFGPEFDRGALCLTILSAAQVVNVSAGLVGLILIMTGHVRDAAEGMTLGATLNVLLNAILIPRWEIEGAAVATGISLIAWNIFLAVRVRSRTGLSSSVFGMRLHRRTTGDSID